MVIKNNFKKKNKKGELSYDLPLWAVVIIGIAVMFYIISTTSAGDKEDVIASVPTIQYQYPIVVVNSFLNSRFDDLGNIDVKTGKSVLDLINNFDYNSDLIQKARDNYIEKVILNDDTKDLNFKFFKEYSKNSEIKSSYLINIKKDLDKTQLDNNLEKCVLDIYNFCSYFRIGEDKYVIIAFKNIE